MTARLRKMQIDYVSFVDSPAEDGSRIVLAKREFGTEKRSELADKGKALPEGGFPIVNRGDLRNAIQAIGRASNPDAARRHIIKRARELGAIEMLPDDWAVSKSDPMASDVHVLVPMGGRKAPPVPKGKPKDRKKLLVDGDMTTEEGEPGVDEATTEEAKKSKVKKALESIGEVLGFGTFEKNTTDLDADDTVSDQHDESDDTEDDPMPSEALEKVLKGDFSVLPDELRDYIEKLEDRVIELEESTDVSADDDNGPEDEPDGGEGGDDGGEGEVLKGASPAVRELFQKMQGQLAETEAIAKAERDARLDREFTDVAKGLSALPASTDDIKAVLWDTAAVGDRDHYERVVGLLTKANEAAKHGALLEEVGKRAPAEGSPEDSIEKIAKGIQTSDPTLTPEQAYDKALQANKGLYSEIVEG